MEKNNLLELIKEVNHYGYNVTFEALASFHVVRLTSDINPLKTDFHCIRSDQYDEQQTVKLIKKLYNKLVDLKVFDI